MAEIPDEFRRVREERVDRILQRHLSTPGYVARAMFSAAFGACTLTLIESALLHQHRDHRRLSGNPLAYGETDIEVVGRAVEAGESERRVALLVENKVDAGQMEKQGLRYQARARYRLNTKDWDDFRCALIAPQSYLDAAYPLEDHQDHGWDIRFSYESIAATLSKDLDGTDDVEILLQATTSANTWNKPIPCAVQFWMDYNAFGRDRFPDIPVIAKAEKGSRVGGVWPSFYDPRLRLNRSRPERKRIQIVHMDTSTYVALFVKKVSFNDFAGVIGSMLESEMYVAPPGGSWQSIRIQVPAIKPTQALERQTSALAQIFEAARRLYDFYLRHEEKLIAIPTREKGRRRSA